jgi:hypothetical protein
MAHCGYESTAVDDMLAHPVKALLTSIRGPKTSGEMIPEVKPEYGSLGTMGSVVKPKLEFEITK